MLQLLIDILTIPARVFSWMDPNPTLKMLKAPHIFHMKVIPNRIH